MLPFVVERDQGKVLTYVGDYGNPTSQKYVDITTRIDGGVRCCNLCI